MNNVVFISFADKKYRTSLLRLKKELQACRIIKEYHLFTEKDLGKDFLRDFHPWLYRRGYGYWKWKAYLVWRELTKLEEGDILIYSDAGTRLNPRGEQRLKEYIEITKKSHTGVLAFQDRFLERQYTKGDVFSFFHVLDNAEYTDTRQFWGGVTIWQKRDSSLLLAETWWKTVHDNYYLITDKRSLTPNYPEFIDNRHDQSVFSLLVKKHRADFIPYTELDKVNYDHIPFLPVRNKQKTKSQEIWGKLLLPWRLLIGLYLKYVEDFDFRSRIAW